MKTSAAIGLAMVLAAHAAASCLGLSAQQCYEKAVRLYFAANYGAAGGGGVADGGAGKIAGGGKIASGAADGAGKIAENGEKSAGKIDKTAEALRAKTMLERACLQDEARACALLGSIAEREGQKGAALADFHRGCAAGVHAACLGEKRLKNE